MGEVIVAIHIKAFIGKISHGGFCILGITEIVNI
jgi:hypothetical protein